MLGVDEETKALSIQYIRVLTLYLWPQLMQRAMISILRCQGVVRPTTFITGAASAINIPVTWFLVSRYGFDGAPWSQVFSGWMQLIMMVFVVKWRGYMSRCWFGWSMDGLRDWGPMLKLGSAGTLSLMGEWWSWEMASGMAATLGEVPLAAHATLLNIGFVYFVFPYGISRGVGIRVGQLLGAGDWQRARMAFHTSCLMALVMITIAISFLSTIRRQIAALYSSDPRVLDLAAQVMLVYFVHMAFTGMNFALQGTMGGCGRQQLMARVSLFSWYCVGLPMAGLCAFVLELGVFGLWMGLSTGPMTSVLVQACIQKRTDWAEQSLIAQERARKRSKAKAEKEAAEAKSNSLRES